MYDQSMDQVLKIQPSGVEGLESTYIRYLVAIEEKQHELEKLEARIEQAKIELHNIEMKKCALEND